jgi:transcriptional regulator with XRE-family HTH domain
MTTLPARGRASAATLSTTRRRNAHDRTTPIRDASLPRPGLGSSVEPTNQPTRPERATPDDGTLSVRRAADRALRVAQKDLGSRLALRRKAAGLSQMELAVQLRYSRSMVANAEVGLALPVRKFWVAADRILAAEGVLLAGFEQVRALPRPYRAANAYRAALRLAAKSKLKTAAAPQRPELLTVARWTGRETRALREAMRLNLRSFATRLRVSPATAARWEDPRTPVPPTLVMQTLLDGLLQHADPEVRIRFKELTRPVPGTGVVTQVQPRRSRRRPVRIRRAATRLVIIHGFNLPVGSAHAYR